jgi:hypothetical protein
MCFWGQKHLTAVYCVVRAGGGGGRGVDSDRELLGANGKMRFWARTAGWAELYAQLFSLQIIMGCGSSG